MFEKEAIRMLFPAWALGVMLLVWAPGRAGEPGERKPIIAPTVGLLRSLGTDLPPGFRQAVVREDAFLGSIRFDHVLDRTEIRELEDVGVHFSRRPEAPVPDVRRAGTVYPAWVEWRALDRLTSHPRVLQVEPDLVVPPLPPLDVTIPKTGADWLGRHIGLTLDQGAGSGIRVADIDAGIDVFHPGLFLPDSGHFAWTDLDGDGTFTPGIDGSDRNGDGTVSDWETLRLLDASFKRSNGIGDPGGDGEFDPAIDWLYLDSNGNGRRDFGLDAGWGDKAPGLGEPCFLADDVDQDGILDPEEKLLLLGTPKVAAALAGGKEYTAGKNLATLLPDKFQTLYLGPDGAMHGTAVAGILAAGVPGRTRYTGMAPGTRLIMIDYSLDTSMGYKFDDSFIERALWARDQGAHVLLLEFGSWCHTFMDGSANLDAALDAMQEEDGLLSAAPAGNLGGTGVHMQAVLPPGPFPLGVNVPATTGGTGYAFETAWYMLSLYWPGKPEELEVSLSNPSGAGPLVLPLETTTALYLAPGIKVESHSAVSSRGFAWRFFMVWDKNDWKIDPGTWPWILTNLTESDIPLHGFVAEGTSMWQRTITFDKGESDDTTVCQPALADSVVAVAAYAGRFGPVGQLRPFTGRGPRMDGQVGIDLAAPDDPISLLAAAKSGDKLILGGYVGFGGTSGAAPHAAGALALLRQLNPEAPGADIVAMLRSGAATEPAMGPLPNKNWGHGRLDTYRAALGKPSPDDNLPPIATAAVAHRQGQKVLFDASGSLDPEGSPLQYRWDFEYDGTPSTAWLDVPEAETFFPIPGTVTVKLMVRDDMGGTGETLLSLEVLDDRVPTDCGGGTDACPPTDGGDISELPAQADGAGDVPDLPSPMEEGGDVAAPDPGPPHPRSSGCSSHQDSAGTAAGILLALLLVVAGLRGRGVRRSAIPHPKAFAIDWRP